MPYKNLYCDACLAWRPHIEDSELMWAEKPWLEKEVAGQRCTDCGTIVLEDGSVVYC